MGVLLLMALLVGGLLTAILTWLRSPAIERPLGNPVEVCLWLLQVVFWLAAMLLALSYAVSLTFLA